VALWLIPLAQVAPVVLDRQAPILRGTLVLTAGTLRLADSRLTVAVGVLLANWTLAQPEQAVTAVALLGRLGRLTLPPGERQHGVCSPNPLAAGLVMIAISAWVLVDLAGTHQQG
jgi:hypothetical protein